MSKCPICNIQLEYWEDSMDNILMEFYEKCPSNHYSVEYHHGYYEVLVNGKGFFWNYHDSFEKVKDIQKDIDKAIQTYKLSINKI